MPRPSIQRPDPVRWWTFEVRLLTPGIIGGAAPRQTDADQPFRAASLRGVLRQWFRMGMADVLGGGEAEGARRQDVLLGLRRLESELFGTTSLGSRLILKAPRGGQVKPLPKPDARRAPGLNYLSYGLFGAGITTAIVPDARGPIRLELRLQRRTGDTEAHTQALERALLATLWLWSNLGGLGARTRRGWGAVELIPKSEIPPDVVPLGVRAGNLADLLKTLNDGLTGSLRALRALARTFGVPLPTGKRAPIPELRTLAGLAGFRVLPREYSSAEEALERAGQLYLDFRSTLRRSDRGQRPLDDYFAVKEALMDGRPPRNLGRAIFGLPLPYFFRSLGNRKAMVLPVPPRRLRYRGPAPDRVPSPLLFRVHALQTGRFAALLLDLDEAAPVPLGGCALRFVGNREDATLEAPDRRLMDEFLTYAIRRAGEQR